jgi:hypothetical protein
MAAPKELVELVERFDRNLASYESGAYNEAQVRAEFIDPMFELLGWDVYNKRGHAEAYKDVIHEDAIQIGGTTKAPDYCFRIGGSRKFFLEAKKPSVAIKDEPNAAYQLRRYAWSAKLPLSLLTDFGELAVYDCRVKPEKTDASAIARINYLTFEQYPDRWAEIAGVFSKDAVLKGSFDGFAVAAKGKRGTAPVDAEFLKEIERWRDELARNIALRNQQLSVRELNFAVQRTIDRIIFLRICEDRGVETDRQFQLQFTLNGPNTYRRLFELFQRADERYNSGLFHFQREKDFAESPDTLTPTLAIDDKVLKDIIGNLYYPDSPYEFSVLPADILGQVYEQFLGKVIRLTEGHRAKVEDKPEVKKAGGVYYTPTYIVDYIVEHTVGKLLEGTTPKQAADLKILDPACGSGSFLLGAYQRLLDWHRDWYVSDGPEKYTKPRKGSQPVLYQAAGGEWRLTTTERKRILLNSIFGVDIDTQAVEVTKLSLLLKVLEGESDQSLNAQLKLFHQRALPDLGSSIKCGNSLIGSDYNQGRQGELFDQEEALRVNPFDWDKGFPEIFARDNPGFDAVIGNPPYILLQDEFRDDEQLAYFSRKFTTASYKVDTYHLFMERGLQLVRSGGRASMITPANFLANNYLVGLRHLLLERSAIDHIAVIRGGVFARVSVDNAIFVTIGGQRTRGPFAMVHAEPQGGKLAATSSEMIQPDANGGDKFVLFTSVANPATRELWERIGSRSVKLGSCAFVNFGKQLRDRKVFPDDVIEISNPRRVKTPYRLCYTGRDVTRYKLTWGGLACLDIDDARRGGCWDGDKQNARNKLICRQIGRYPEFGIDRLGYQCLNTVFMVNLFPECKVAPAYVLGVLNSRLLRAVWTDRFYDQRNTFPKIKGTYLKELPIRRISFDDPRDRGYHDRLVEVVDRILAMHTSLAAVGTDHEKTVVKRQIDATDREIDALVYELYGLTDDEIRIVEEATP